MGDVLHALPALQQHDRSEEQQQARVQVVPRPPSLASQSQVLPLGRARSALHSRARPSPSARPILAELVRYALELVPDGFAARTHLVHSQCYHSGSLLTSGLQGLEPSVWCKSLDLSITPLPMCSCPPFFFADCLRTCHME